MLELLSSTYNFQPTISILASIWTAFSNWSIL